MEQSITTSTLLITVKHMNCKLSTKIIAQYTKRVVTSEKELAKRQHTKMNYSIEFRGSSTEGDARFPRKAQNLLVFNPDADDMLRQ